MRQDALDNALEELYPQIREDKHIGFKRLVSKLQEEGHDEDSAKRIAASVGFAKYGKKGMEAKARAGK